MKAIALGAALALSATTAFAGNFEPMAADPAPMVEAPMVEESGMSAWGWLIPVIAIAAIVASQD